MELDISACIILHCTQSIQLSTAWAPCRVHDSDGNGTVSYEEFRSLHKFLVDIQQTFQAEDSSRRGCLDKQTVEHILQNQGMLLMTAPLMGNQRV